MQSLRVLYENASAYVNSAVNYASIISHPKSDNDIKRNRELRFNLLFDYVTKLADQHEDMHAVKQFWAVQTWFLVYFLKNKFKFLHEEFDLDSDHFYVDKKTLLNITAQLIFILENNTEKSGVSRLPSCDNCEKID